MLGKQIVGTSNTLLASRYNLTPIGTNAHELPMVLVALAQNDVAKRAAQYEVLSHWQGLYGIGLRVFLPDTYTTAQFLEHAPEWLARDWRGMRQDSGDPFKAAHLYINWLKRHGVDPREKLIIFSDGLDVEPMKRLHDEFSKQIKVAFGWGTLLTNDFRGCFPKNPLFRPFSLVCKVRSANGIPAVKLSDNIEKATGPQKEVERYIKIFGSDGRISEKVVV